MPQNIQKRDGNTRFEHMSITVFNGAEVFKLNRDTHSDGHVTETRSENLPEGATIEDIITRAFAPKVTVKKRKR